MLKFLLALSALASLFYLVFPREVELAAKKGDILGSIVSTGYINKPTVETALLAYCLDEGVLPEELNKLYDGYLEKEYQPDLDKLYDYIIMDSKQCMYNLTI